jgi:3-oxoisoapionate kinase
MTAPSVLQLAFYGDDFTGSTDALEFLTRAGLRTRLFLAPPSPAHTVDLDAIGVAGLTRALPPASMEADLRPAFAGLRALSPRHVHYKVCSTFDSSPTVGSIGRAIEVGADFFRGPFVPLLVAAPALGRHCVFGNMFARYGIGSAGAIHRLDRHPAMSRHPVTPAGESDLRLHLAKQTGKRIGLLDILTVAQPESVARASLERMVNGGFEVVLFDALYENQLPLIGALLDELASQERPLFSAGSSGIEMALGAHWNAAGTFSPRADWPTPRQAEPLLVISGSCSPVTAGQIAWAEAHNFTIIPLDERAQAAASASLTVLRNTVVCSSRGASGPVPIPAAELGPKLGRLARDLVDHHAVQRLVVAGGDTSSYAARALGIKSLEMLAPMTPGAPLCRACAPGSPVDGLEINFKGGQVGPENYFGLMANPS